MNRHYNQVEKASPVSEFLDENREFIFLLDDNFLAYKNWSFELDSLKETNKRIKFTQGLDLRLMTEAKAKSINELRFCSDVIFAFDNIKDYDIIKEKLVLYRKYCNKPTVMYLLVGYYNSGTQELNDLISRIKLVLEYKAHPFIMKHKNYKMDILSSIYVDIARYYNSRRNRKFENLIQFIDVLGSKKTKSLIKDNPSLKNILEPIRYE